MELFTPIFVDQPEVCYVRAGNFRRQCIRVRIVGSEYRICHEYSFKRWANTKKGKYGSGILNAKGDERKVERIGLLGEMAFGKFAHQPVNIGYMEGGDQYDFLIKNKTIDIKINSRLNSKNPAGFMIAYDNENAMKYGKCKANIKDIHVLGFLEEEDRELETATVVFIGSISGSWIKNNIDRITKPSRVYGKDHINYELSYSDSKDIFVLQH